MGIPAAVCFAFLLLALSLYHYLFFDYYSIRIVVIALIVTAMHAQDHIELPHFEKTHLFLFQEYTDLSLVRDQLFPPIAKHFSTLLSGH